MDAENSLAAVLCQVGSIVVAHNLNKDKNNRPLDCNVRNIDSSSIKLNPNDNKNKFDGNTNENEFDGNTNEHVESSFDDIADKA
jgi:nickel-dependent lactate racemase